MKIFYDVPMDILEVLYEEDGAVNKRYIKKKTNGTYSHVLNIIGKLEEKGFLESEKVGREYKIELTRRGKNMARILTIAKKFYRESFKSPEGILEDINEA